MARVEDDLTKDQWTALQAAWGGCAYCSRARRWRCQGGEKLMPTRPANSVTVRQPVLPQFTNGGIRLKAWLPILIYGSVPNA
jgi:hypothetical protein